MFDFFAKFFDTSDFPDRWHCGQWSDFHGWLHIISDLAVFGAYLTIPFVMLYFLRRRSDIPFPRIFFLFAAFIFACGTVHLVEATIFWWPIYRISGTFKLLTALVSWATVIGLIRILPAAITMRSAATELETEAAKRKEAEKSLRIQERALQSAVNGIFITDPNQQGNPIVYVNQAAQMMTGFSAEEMLGRNCRFLQNDDREQEALIEIKNAIEEERECKVELRNYRKDGTPFWNELMISPVRDKQGALTHFIGIQTDITERRKNAEALRKSEQRFAAFMDNSPFVAWVKDSKGRHLYFSQPYEDQIGIPDDDWKGKTDFELWPKEVAESHREMDAKVLKTGKPINFESNHPLSNGETRNWYVIKFPFNIEGDQVFVGGIAVDMTEQRRAESERDRFFETSSDFMCIADFQGNFKRVNQAFTDVLGFSREELLAKPYVEFIHPSDVRSTETAVGQIIAGGSLIQFENRFRCKDGSYRLISWTTPSPEPDAKVMHAAGRDVTEQRSLERSLLQIADNEQRRIAHDLHDGLGQELAGVSMMAESLANSLEAKTLPESKLATKIAVQLVASLQLTRSLARGLRPVEIDTQGLESALSQLADQTSEMYGIKCSFDCGGDLNLNDPESATHLYRIAQEAVANATKHGKPMTVEIHLSESNGVLELKVIDDGVGIKHEPESQEGIGMKSMGYRCAMIGGKLRVESGESGGTIVACRLAAF